GFKPWLYTRCYHDRFRRRIEFWQEHVPYPVPQLSTAVMNHSYSPGPYGMPHFEIRTTIAPEQAPFDDTSFLVCKRDYPTCFIRGVIPSLVDAPSLEWVLLQAMYHVVGIVRQHFNIQFMAQNLVIVCTQRMRIAWEMLNESMLVRFWDHEDRMSNP